MPYKAIQRLNLTRDGRVVPSGHPQSATLLVPLGGELSDSEARKYGLVQGQLLSVEDAAPLEPAPPIPQVLSVRPDPPPPPPDTSHGFPQELKFGRLPEQPAPPPPLPDAPEPEAPPLSETALPETSTPGAPEQPPVGVRPLPVEFPHRMILEGQGYGTIEKILTATREELINLQLIGSSRADEIIAAREKLRGEQSALPQS